MYTSDKVIYVYRIKYAWIGLRMIHKDKEKDE